MGSTPPPGPSLASTMSPVAPGDVLGDKYKVERVLAVGGMGVVVAARHMHLDERVAIKFLQAESLKNEEAVNRFAREARAAVRIKSEHVARVIDVGTLEKAGPFMVMEYLEGEDLSVRLERVQRMPMMDAVDLILQACEAIAEAHTLGIVHRDLKPGNLFLIERPDGTPCVKVLDFGISKIDSRISRVNAMLTAATAVMGSPLYMAPEQMRASRDIDSRVDIWALGMILYELITGRAAFDAESIPEICLKIYNDAPPSMRTIRPEVPLALERVVFGALEKDPAKRYATVGDFASALLPFGAHRARYSVERVHGTLNRAGIVTGPIAPPSDRPAPQDVLTLDASSMTAALEATRRATPATWEQKPQRKRSPFVIGAALGAVVVAGAILYVARIGSHTTADRASAAGTTAPPAGSDIAALASPPRAGATAPPRDPPPVDNTARGATGAAESPPSATAKEKEAAPRLPRLPARASASAAAPKASTVPVASPATPPAPPPPNPNGLFDDPK